MPYYTYRCQACGASETRYAKISERDALVGSGCAATDGCNGTLIRPPEVPGFTTSESLGRVKAPAEFRNLLSHIAKENPRSTIKER